MQLRLLRPEHETLEVHPAPPAQDKALPPQQGNQFPLPVEVGVSAVAPGEPPVHQRAEGEEGAEAGKEQTQRYVTERNRKRDIEMRRL